MAAECAVIAGGPSLTDADLVATTARGCEVIAVNDAYRRCRPDVIYAADGAWWDAYARAHVWPCDSRPYPGATEVGAECWTATPLAAERYGLRLAEIQNGEGLSVEPGRLVHGGHSGHQAVNLAVQRGARRIILLGFDMMAAEDGRRHWFGDHPGAMHKESPYPRWAAAFDTMARALDRMGVEVINCSRRTAITAFPRSRIEALV